MKKKKNNENRQKVQKVKKQYHILVTPMVKQLGLLPTLRGADSL
jgi:hypothetical protein